MKFLTHISGVFSRKSFGLAALLVAAPLAGAANASEDPITIGFAVAQSGIYTAYDQGATQAALLAIEQINENGGINGREVKSVVADTKSDRQQGARAALQVIDEGADLVVVTCDYDFGAPAALEAHKAGLISISLCAEDAKMGPEGIGPYAFTASIAAGIQGAVMAEWGYERKGFRKAFVLLDNFIEYNKSVCAGFEAAWEDVGGEIVGKDVFLSTDPSIAPIITRLKRLRGDKKPDTIMYCTIAPLGASALRQLRASGINLPIVSTSAMDGLFWLDAVPDLTSFYFPVQASIYGNDPREKVNAFNDAFRAKYGADVPSQYTYPGFVLVEFFAEAVRRAGSAETRAVLEELHRMKDFETLVGPRSFTPELHIQNQANMLVIELDKGEHRIIEDWTNSKPLTREVLFRLK